VRAAGWHRTDCSSLDAAGKNDSCEKEGRRFSVCRCAGNEQISNYIRSRNRRRAPSGFAQRLDFIREKISKIFLKSLSGDICFRKGLATIGFTDIGGSFSSSAPPQDKQNNDKDDSCSDDTGMKSQKRHLAIYVWREISQKGKRPEALFKIERMLG
jgi:hypothetical protein